MLVLLCLLAAPSFAWWQLGHMLVAQIAYNGISPVLRLNVDAIARGNEEVFGFSPNFIESASWMDDVKALGLTAFNDWHYVDEPYVLGNVTVPPPATANLTWALRQMRDAYRTTRASLGSRCFALRCLVHLVGDAGQPMHATSLFSDAFPDGDAGGNSFRVRYRGMNTNLHSFFDSGAFRLNDTLSQPLTTGQSLRLSQLAGTIESQFPFSSFPAAQLAFDPAGWIQQSRAHAISTVYLNGQLQVNSDITEEYATNAYNLALQQIALSGYRLQLLLTQNQVPTATSDFGRPTWIVIVVASTCGAFVVGLVGGVFGHWLLQRRRKRFRYLSSIDRDSEDDLVVAREV
jgi:hypothetical protein